MTSDQSQMTIFELLEESEAQYTLSQGDFLAKASQALESVMDLKTLLAEHYSLKSSGSHLFSDLNIYFLRTSPDSLATTKGEPSKPSSERWMSWGMWGNGVCLTARPTSLKSENEFSLSQALEEQVDERYFLSHEKQSLIMDIIEEKGTVALYQHGRGNNKGGWHKQFAPTLTSNGYEYNHSLYDGKRIRRLTSLEFFRLQSFPDHWYYKLKESGMSDSQLYRMAGNAVTSNVAFDIGKRINAVA